MLASKILPQVSRAGWTTRAVDHVFGKLRRGYHVLLQGALRHAWIVGVAFVGILAGTVWLLQAITDEYAPKEDRGVFYLLVNGPEGASYDYMAAYMTEIERRMMPLVESGEISRLLVRAPRAFGNYEIFNDGIVINVLTDWSARRSAWEIMDDVRSRLKDLSGVRAFPVMRQGFGARVQKPVQFVIGGGTYRELAQWRDILLEKIAQENPGLVGLDWDYKETKPQIRVVIDYDRAAELGVTISAIGRTLETMLGSRRVTTYIDAGEEYDVILEGERELKSCRSFWNRLCSARLCFLLPVTASELFSFHRLLCFLHFLRFLSFLHFKHALLCAYFMSLIGSTFRRFSVYSAPEFVAVKAKFMLKKFLRVYPKKRLKV